MRVTVIPIVVDVLGMIPKGMEKTEELKIREKIKNIHTTALLRLGRIHRRVPETRGDLLSFRIQLKATS